MRVYSKPVPTTPTSIVELVGNVINQVSAVGLQAPETNAFTIFFGDKNQQPFELRPEANAILPINQAKDVYIQGTSGDKISIGFF